MKIKLYFLFVVSLIAGNSVAQDKMDDCGCTNNAEVQAYKKKIDASQDVQCNSQLATLAVYMCMSNCSANQKFLPELQKVIGQSKANIKAMGCSGTVSASIGRGGVGTSNASNSISSGVQPTFTEAEMKSGGYAIENFDGSFNSSLETMSIGLGKTIGKEQLDADLVIGAVGVAANILANGAERRRQEEARAEALREQKAREERIRREMENARASFFDRLNQKRYEPRESQSFREGAYFFGVNEESDGVISFSQVYHVPPLSDEGELPFRSDLERDYKQDTRKTDSHLRGPFKSQYQAKMDAAEIAKDAKQSFIGIYKEVDYSYSGIYDKDIDWNNFDSGLSESSEDSFKEEKLDFWGNDISDSDKPSNIRTQEPSSTLSLDNSSSNESTAAVSSSKASAVKNIDMEAYQNSVMEMMNLTFTDTRVPIQSIANQLDLTSKNHEQIVEIKKQVGKTMLEGIEEEFTSSIESAFPSIYKYFEVFDNVNEAKVTTEKFTEGWTLIFDIDDPNIQDRIDEWFSEKQEHALRTLRKHLLPELYNNSSSH